MYRFSDSDSVDSDEGIRYKTESIRNKTKKSEVSKNDRDRSEHRQSHGESSYSSRTRKYSSSDNESSNRKSKRRRERSTGRSRSENNHKSEKSRRVDKNKVKSSDIEKKERLENSSRKTGGKPEEKMVVCRPELPQNSVKKSAIFEPTNPNKEDKELDYFGPALPPHLRKNNDTDNTSKDLPNKETNTSLNGPELVQETNKTKEKEPENVLGPCLPSHIKKPEETPAEDDEPTEDKCIGPTLPPHLRQKLAEAEPTSTTDDLEEGEVEEETYGPVPLGSQFSKAHLDLEERALQMKINQLGPAEKEEPVREEWMVELPAARAANLGLGPRKFRSKAGPDLSDRSSWTDTPKDKAEKKPGREEPKVDLQREAELKEMRKRDKEQEVAVKKSKRGKESLVDIHTKKLKEKKDSTVSNERRPFNREVDLQVNRFDEAQKKAVLKKAQLLDTRFSSGESKFL